jgi:hypothetical protein
LQRGGDYLQFAMPGQAKLPRALQHQAATFVLDRSALLQSAQRCHQQNQLQKI